MYVLYTDGSILGGPHKYEVDQEIKGVQYVKLNITIKGDIQYFLVIDIDSRRDGSINLMKPHLIDQILEDVKMGGNAKRL